MFSSEEVNGFHEAIIECHGDKVMEILEDQPDLVNVQDDFFQETALHVAAEYGHDDIVEFLLDQGADINKKDGAEQTPFHLAALNGKESTVNLLLKRKADPAILNNDNESPLNVANYNGHTKIAAVIEKYMEDQVRLSTENQP